MDLVINLVTLIIPTLIILGFLIWFKKDLEKKREKERIDKENELRNIHNELIADAMTKLTKIAKDTLASEKETIATDLKNKKETIEQLVKRIEDDLRRRQKELEESNKQTLKHFSDVSRQIREHQKTTQDLKVNTEQLARILSNNQLRGDWGEKILEDILQSAGLEKGIHFVTQESMQSGVRPDVVILLPEEKKINIDVKFPYQKIMKMTQVKSVEEKRTLKEGFERDVKNRLKEIVKRNYINVEEGTMDFAIMFIPNERVFSYINKEFPLLIEEAFNRKIIIASPFSLYAIARTIMQGYRNYYFEQNIRQVLKHIEALKEQFGRFSKEFETLGKSFDSVYKNYKQIAETRFTGLNRAFKKIEESERQTKLEPPKTKRALKQ